MSKASNDDRDCTCPWVDPALWTTYGSAVEPGSTREFDPECPVHRLRADEIESGR